MAQKIWEDFGVMGVVDRENETNRIYSRSHFNGNSDNRYYPEITKTRHYYDLHKTGFVDYTAWGLATGFVTPEQIDKAIVLNWNKPPTTTHDETTLEKFNKDVDLEFKNCFLLSAFKIETYPNTCVSKLLFDNVMANYLNNLVFTKWLYRDYIIYQKYIREQKKRKRDNHKRNLRERLDHYG